MQYTQLLAAFLISLVATLIAIAPVRRLAIARGWVDRPDGHRKLHPRAVVCVGGIAILVGVTVGIAYLLSIDNVLPFDFELPSPFLLGGAALVFAMGLADDVKGVSLRTKFGAQIAAAALLVTGGLKLGVVMAFFPFLDPSVAFFLTILVTMLWVVGIINAVNLVDGLDGLAAGLTLIGFCAFAGIYGLGGEIALLAMAVPVIGALTGFLIRNFNPASIFMGNSGSYLLGFLLATYSIQKPAHSDPIVAVMIAFVVLGLPVVDTMYSIFRRFLRGASPFAPDCDHTHHRLTRRFTHRGSVVILYAGAIILGSAGIIMAGATPAVALLVFGAVTLAGLAALRVLSRYSTMRWPHVVGPVVATIGKSNGVIAINGKSNGVIAANGTSNGVTEKEQQLSRLRFLRLRTLQSHPD